MSESIKYCRRPKHKLPYDYRRFLKFSDCWQMLQFSNCVSLCVVSDAYQMSTREPQNATFVCARFASGRLDTCSHLMSLRPHPNCFELYVYECLQIGWRGFGWRGATRLAGSPLLQKYSITADSHANCKLNSTPVNA